MVEDIIGSVIASLITAALIAFIGYLFRNKIKCVFRKEDLLSANDLPNLSAKIDGSANAHNGACGTMLLLFCNTGSASLSRIRPYFGKLTSETLALTPIGKNKTYSVSHNGSGEAIQFRTDAQPFLNSQSPCENRLYVQATDSKGINYIFMFYIHSDGKTIKLIRQSIMRAKRRLPEKGVCACGKNRVQCVAKRYSIDLSVG